MRSNLTCTFANQPFALAAIYYDTANTSTIPASTASPNPNPQTCNNDPLNQTVPVYAMKPPTPATTVTLNITVGPNSTLNWLWSMNGSPLRTDYNSPVLLLAAAGNTSGYPTDWNVINVGSNSSYRFIVNNQTPLPHPMHFHGHNFFVLNVGGPGVWDGTTIINPNNPQRRDVQIVPAGGFMVWQATADNPGAWPFHCEFCSLLTYLHPYRLATILRPHLLLPSLSPLHRFIQNPIFYP